MDNGKIEKYLLDQRKEIEEQLRKADHNHSYQESPAESVEPGTLAWEADVKFNALVVRNQLSKLASKINHALSLLKSGVYGICERCERQIENERLEAMPLATLCLSCSFVK